MEGAPDFKVIGDFSAYDSDKNPILYHYCDLNAFLSIIQNRTIRVSDINTLNDYGEMHWAYDRFIEAANIHYDEYGEEFLDACDDVLSNLQTHTLPSVACFSLDGDVLSQWRAYAGDGSGLALGFDGNLLKKLSVKCAKVVYDRQEQLKYFRHNLLALKPIWEASRDHAEAMSDFRELTFYLAVDMCLMKNPAFAEEREVRIVRALSVERKQGQWRLFDVGGSSKDKPSKRKQEVKFRARGGGLVAYVDLPFQGLGNGIIREVVLGPKTENNGVEISMALSASGFSGFEIRHSEATYR